MPSAMFFSQIARYSSVIGGCCPRTGGLVGSYWPPAPMRTHSPFQLGNFERSCACTLVMLTPYAAASSAATARRDEIGDRVCGGIMFFSCGRKVGGGSPQRAHCSGRGKQPQTRAQSRVATECRQGTIREGSMLSRRNFLNSAIGASVVLAGEGAQRAAAQAPANRRIIVDAQVHQWKAQAPDRPWPPGAVPQLPEPFGPDKLMPMM